MCCHAACLREEEAWPLLLCDKQEGENYSASVGWGFQHVALAMRVLFTLCVGGRFVFENRVVTNQDCFMGSCSVPSLDLLWHLQFVFQLVPFKHHPHGQLSESFKSKQKKSWFCSAASVLLLEISAAIWSHARAP